MTKWTVPILVEDRTHSDYSLKLKGRGRLGLGGCSLLGGGLLSLLLCGLLLLGGLSRGSLGISTVGRRPQGQVVTEQLHDEGAVTVGLLAERVKLGNGVIEGLLGEVAGAVGGVQDLVVEDGEVEGQAKTDGVGGGQLGLGNVGGGLKRVGILANMTSSLDNRGPETRGQSSLV